VTVDKPMLAFPGDPALIARLLVDDRFCCQQKVDGERALVLVDAGKVTVLNRTGSTSRCATQQIRQVFARLHQGSWCFDGEILDGTLWLFDMPEAAGLVDCATPFGLRFGVLAEMFDRVLAGSDAVRLLPVARTTSEKVALRDKVRRANGEGLVLKDVDAPYLPGKRSRYLYKDKHWHEADCVVTAVGVGWSKHTNSTKANMELSVFRGSTLVKVCECGDGGLVVKVGDVVEVRYLTWSGSSLIQPTLPRRRMDKAPEECTWDQLAPSGTKAVLLEPTRSTECGVA